MVLEVSSPKVLNISVYNWNNLFLELVVVPSLMQLGFYCGIVIVDTPVIVFGGCCNLWLGCCCTPCFDFQAFLEIFTSFLNFYSKEDWNSSATIFEFSQLCLSYHLRYYLTDILMV